MIIRVCDVCSKPAESVSFSTGKGIGPSGSIESDYESLDLCDHCIASAYRVYMASLPSATQETELRMWKRKIKSNAKIPVQS